MEQNRILISQGNRPWWQIIVAALFYTAMIACLYHYFMEVSLRASPRMIRRSTVYLQLAIFFFAGGFSFSVVKDYYFDIKKRKYKIQFCVGPVKMGIWKKFRNLNYISVFRNGRNIYEVNLWYDRNRHFNLTAANEATTALLMGKQLAEKLDIDLLDATFPHNSKWVDKNP